MLTHKQRVEKARDFTNKNKLFIVIVGIILCFFIGSFIHNRVTEYKEYRELQTAPNTSITTSANTETESTVATNSNEKSKEKPHWRFYWTDAWILAIGGGFCVIMIIRERAKAREKL